MIRNLLIASLATAIGSGLLGVAGADAWAQPSAAGRGAAARALLTARGALDRAERSDSLKHELKRTLAAWEVYGEAEGAYIDGDNARVPALAAEATRLAEAAAEASVDGVFRERVADMTRELMTDVYAATDVIPIVRGDGIGLAIEGLFEPNSATLTDRGSAIVDTMAEIAQRYLDFQIRIEGYVPSVSTATLNLMQTRLVEATNALGARGVDIARVTSRRKPEPRSRIAHGVNFVFIPPDLADGGI